MTQVNYEGSQQSLFLFTDETQEQHLLPSIWKTAEELVTSDGTARLNALEHLVRVDAIRSSPLITYLVATRISDPVIAVRKLAIRALGEVLNPPQVEPLAPDKVRLTLFNYLSEMRTRQVFALLQVLIEDNTLESYIKRLLFACPYAGAHLTSILMDKSISLKIREQAVLLIGQVGYIEVIPELERLVTKLEARLNGQYSMFYAPPQMFDESLLLPALHSTLSLLHAP